MNAIIACERLALGYEGRLLLDDVNLEIRGGTFLPFVGPNGAGKTTLLRAITGLTKPLSGLITTPFAERPPGYVSQQKSIDPLYPVSALDIVMMGFYPCMGWRGSHRDSCVSRARELLERFDLLEHENKTFDQLSGGMRQKLLIARALACDPEVLIMDEPTTELDHKTQVTVLGILRNAVESEGRTVLLVHHGIATIRGMAHEVCLINDGTARMVAIDEAVF